MSKVYNDRWSGNDPSALYYVIIDITKAGF